MTATRVANERVAREEELMSRVRQRDRRAFQELYVQYRPRVWRFLMQVTKRQALAEEALNETMLAVWTGIDSFKGESKFSTWVFAIAYRKGLKSLRNNDDPTDDGTKVERPAEEDNPEISAGKDIRAQMLRAAFAQLSPEHRAVIEMTYYNEMKYREIAEVMQCPEETVKTRMFHARRKLRKLLSGDQADWI